MLKGIDKSIIKYLIASALILLPVILFPISTDLSAFIQGGRILADGGHLYNDFFDVKPPFLYYFFGVLAKLFTNNLILYRIFEYFFVLTTLSISSTLFLKLTISRSTIKVFTILYSIAYVTLNYTNTLQTETLFFLPSIVYFYYILIDKRTVRTGLFAGLWLGVIVGLKYTFGILLLASLVYDFFICKKNIKDILRYHTVQIVVMVLFVILTLLPIYWKGNWDGFMYFNDYLTNYISENDVVFGSYNAIYNAITNNFIEFISPIIFSFFIFSFYFSSKISNRINNVYSLSLVICVLLFATVLIESKYFIYHFARFYPFLILVSSISMVQVFKVFRNKNILIRVSFLFFCLFFSPLPRYFNILIVSKNYFMDSDKFYENYNNYNKQLFHSTNLKTADYINNKFPLSNTLVVNTSNNSIINMLEKMPVNSFAHSAFYLSKSSNEGLRKIFWRDLNNSNTLLIQINDYTPQIFLNNKTSKDFIFEELKYKNYIDSKFELDTLLFDTYEVYKRKEEEK